MRLSERDTDSSGYALWNRLVFIDIHSDLELMIIIKQVMILMGVISVFS